MTTLSPVAELARSLIRCDTTNPPGNEVACVEVLEKVFAAAGLASRRVALDEARPSLLVTLEGTGEAAPLLFYGHLDVVTTAQQCWTHPPFAGVVENGYLWGRGALDMKSGVAMLTAAIIEAQRRGIRPKGDIIYCALADEESGGEKGAGFLVDNHPELFDGVRFAIGEFGGFSLYLGEQVFFPLMVGEKQICQLRIQAHGTAGHASNPPCDGAITRMARFLTALEQQPAPIVVTPIVEALVEAVQDALPGVSGLLEPTTAPEVLSRLGPYASLFAPLLRATVCPTMLAASSAINVIPATVTADLDCRLLPGQGPEDVCAHLRPLLERDMTLEVVDFQPCSGEPDLALFPLLASVLTEAVPGARACPFILGGSTDGRHFARLGIQTYGFTPLHLPRDFDFFDLAHAPDERVPISALDFGVARLFELIERYC